MNKTKSSAKTRQLLYADLNFISEKPLETIIEELLGLESEDVRPYVMPLDEDSAAFQLLHTRNNRITAEVSGRLQRWAGDMTHVYCDGRSFRKPTSYLRDIGRWVVILLTIAPCILFSLSAMVYERGGYAVTVWGTLFWISLLAFIGFWGGSLLLRILALILRIELFTNRGHQREPSEKKDRERLLHVLTGVIRDANSADRTQPDTVPEGQPLTDDEVAAFIQHAELMFKVRR